MSLSIGEFLHEFDESEHRRLDNGGNNRTVYAIDSECIDRLGLDGEYVVKNAKGKRGLKNNQNRKEIKAYLESNLRNQNFVPRSLGGSSDFRYIVVERLNPLPKPRTQNPWRQDTRMQMYDEDCREVLPEGWTDLDEIELGVGDGDVKIMDGGILHRDDWIVEKPLQSDMVEEFFFGTERYFTIKP